VKIVKYVNGGWVCVLRLSKRTVPIDKKYKNDIIVLYNQWLMYEKFRILIVTKKEFRKRRKMLKILLIIYIVMELLIGEVGNYNNDFNCTVRRYKYFSVLLL
jgi:hypothetical protein